jgi:hypothetical protein
VVFRHGSQCSVALDVTSLLGSFCLGLLLLLLLLLLFYLYLFTYFIFFKLLVCVIY